MSFSKVEASKFTEVGYVGRDVESMIRDLTEAAIGMVKQEHMHRKTEEAALLAEDRLLDLCYRILKRRARRTRKSGDEEKFRQKLRDGLLDEKQIDLEVAGGNAPMLEFMPVSMNDNMDMNIRDMLSNLMPKRKKRRKTKIAEAKTILQQEEVSKLIDMDEVSREAVSRVEQTGIVFLDEIDKVASRRGATQGPDVPVKGFKEIYPLLKVPPSIQNMALFVLNIFCSLLLGLFT